MLGSLLKDLVVALVAWPQGLLPLLSTWTLVLTAGAAVAIPLQVGLVNLGCEGQILMAGVGCVLPALLPEALRPTGIGGVLLSWFCGGVVGTLWALIPLALKTLRGVHEVVSGIFLNTIAAGIVTALVSGPWRDPQGWNPESPVLPWRLGLLPEGALEGPSIVLFLCIIFLAFLFFLQKYCLWGTLSHALARAPEAARFSAFPIKRAFLYCGFWAGIFACLSASHDVLGTTGRLRDNFAGGIGFVGIGVALLARNRFWGLLLSALFFALLWQAGQTLQLLTDRVPATISGLLQGLVMLVVVWIAARRNPPRGDAHA